MAEEDVTLGEVYRLAVKIESSMLTKDEFYARQEGIDRRFTHIEGNVQQWRSESAAEHVGLEAKINAVRLEGKVFIDTIRAESKSDIDALAARIDRKDAQDSDRSFKIWLGIGLGAIGVIFGVFGDAIHAGLGL